MNIDEHAAVKRAADAIRVYHAVAIVGAGASYGAGLPLAPELRPLLWDALNQDPSARDALAERFALPPTSAKRLVGDDPTFTRAAFEAMAVSPIIRRHFQTAFTRLDAERARTPSPVHDVLAELLHRRVVEVVVSFNWDTLLETAYRRRYGIALTPNSEWLIKPHGSASDPYHDWVLPHESGLVPDNVIKRVNGLAAEHPRVLLIVGYSEGDEAVVQKLINPFSDLWRVVRIGPSASGEISITLPAQRALPDIAEALALGPEVPGWEYVRFDNQRGLGAALRGIGLGPADVEACPRLPEVAETEQLLRVSNSAVVVGSSGSGKSITAFQTAYARSQQQQEILRLVDPNRPTAELVAAVENLPRPSVLVVDDAQAIDRQLVRALLDRGNQHLAVLAVSSERVDGHTNIRVAARRAVRTLADDYLRRREETLEVVRELDRRIGESYFDESIERRISVAAEQETPWQFSFVLTGGWQRARQQVAELRDFDRADLLLAAIAARQLATLDAPVSRDWLARAGNIVNRMPPWVSESERKMREDRVVLGNDRVRCPHARHAEVVLRVVCKDRRESEWDRLIAMLRAAISHGEPPIRGIAWLLRELYFADGFVGKGRAFGTIVDDSTLRRLAERCWAAETNEERGAAASLLLQLLDWHPTTVNLLSEQRELIGGWVQEADADSAGGLGWLMNGLYHQDSGREVAEGICAAVDPSAMARSLARIDWPDINPLWWLLSSLTTFASPEWRSRLLTDLDIKALQALVLNIPETYLWVLHQLIEGVAEIDYGLGLELFSLASPAIADGFNRSPADTWEAVSHEILFFLRYISPVLGVPSPSPEHQRIGRRIARQVDPMAIGRFISDSRRRDWRSIQELLVFLSKAAPSQAREVVKRVNFDALDRVTAGLWPTLPDDLIRLIWGLFIAEGSDSNGATHEWVERHEPELGAVDPQLAIVAPRAVVSAIQRGVNLDLNVDKGWDWDLAAVAVWKLGEVAPDCADRVLEENRHGIARGLGGLQESDCEWVPIFLRILKERKPNLLESVLSLIDPATAEEHWATRLRAKQAERRAVAALLDLASAGPPALSEVAQRLRRRFPAASRCSS